MTDFNREMPHERYQRDPAFASIVDVLFHYIATAAFTPTELREACHLAACKYEMYNVKPLFIDPKQPFKWNLTKYEEQIEMQRGICEEI